MHDRAGRAAPPAGHLQGIDDQFGAQVVGDGPADHAATEHVQHGRQIDPALVGGVLGDVSDPEPVRAVGMELPLHVIGPDRLGSLMVPPPPPVHSRQSVQAHQPRNSPPTHRLPVAEHQLGVNPPIPVRRPRRGVDVDDLVQQDRVVDVPGRGSAT